ncbi:MAG: TAG lipase/steryl ester hydrolase/phospholipase A2/LPA acyltransferase, partial [Candidatus Azotimanducaceae bacterium]
MEIGTFEQWQKAAREYDRQTGADTWRSDERSAHYDHRVIQYRYDELVKIRRAGNPVQLLYYLNEGLHGNMGGMGTPKLYGKTKLGTKNLITDYLAELSLALEDLAHANDKEVSSSEKLAYFKRASICFGRSALMFSGAGSLGAFHIGVAKELSKQNLMPRVVSGASAGSLIASIIGTHPRNELLDVFDQNTIGGDFEAPDAPQISSSTQHRVQRDDLIGMVEATIPDLTFLEAYEITGVNLNISVSPSELHQRSRMLNAATAPNAFIREAVTASCAIPGVFPAVTLMAKDGNKRRPYVASRKWVDGSITDDLPAKRIARQYGVNHFISSQANPLFLWGLNSDELNDDLISRMTAIYHRGAREWLRAIYPTVMESVRDLHPMNTYTRFWFSMMTQEYTADINIIPQRNILHPSKLLAHL